nr:T9SS type A sorting domain-containing protein [bacterium]
SFRLEDEAVDPLVISVLWHLEGISRIEFDLDTLDFGVLEGEPEPQEMTLTIYNTGTDFLSIESIQVNGEVFHCSGEFPIDIEVFDSTEVEVQFSPEEYGTYEGSLVFTTNDPRGDVEIPMRGVYYAPPSITVNPAGIESINGGEYDLTIGNSGGAILNWSVNDIPEWISIDPDSGLVEINGEVEIAVMIDTTGLEPGNHQSSISIHSNDPENEEVIIDVSLAVFPSSVHNEIEFPTEFSLISIYPNPFNSTTTITYGLPVSGYVSLELFNQSGQRKKTLTTGYEKAGTHQANLNSDALPSGLYFLKYQAGNKITTGKVILVK